MIDTSAFVYSPYYASCSFLGFSRDEKENQITEECWRNIRHMFDESVYYRFHRFHINGSIGFRSDLTKVGITLTELQRPMKTLYEIAKEKIEEEQLVGKLEAPARKIVKKFLDISIPSLYEKSVENFSSQDPKQLSQRKTNEFAVKILSEMCIEANIDKKHILKQIEQAKKDGYLPAKSYYDLQSTILKS